MKKCNACGEQKLLEDFNIKSSSKDNRQAMCRDCFKQWYLSNSDLQKKRTKNWYYNAKNRPTRIETRKKYDSTFKAKMLRKGYKANRRAIERGAKVVDPRLVFAYKVMYGYFGDFCMHPGCLDIYTVIDHIVPISKGGLHDFQNFQLLCTRHNAIKGNRNSIDYRPVLMSDEDIQELLI